MVRPQVGPGGRVGHPFIACVVVTLLSLARSSQMDDHASTTCGSDFTLPDPSDLEAPELITRVASRLRKSLQPRKDPSVMERRRSRSRSRSIGKRLQQEALARTCDGVATGFPQRGISAVFRSPAAHTEQSVAQDSSLAGNLAQTEQAREACAACASARCVLTAQEAGPILTCSCSRSQVDSPASLTVLT